MTKKNSQICAKLMDICEVKHIIDCLSIKHCLNESRQFLCQEEVIKVIYYCLSELIFFRDSSKSSFRVRVIVGERAEPRRNARSDIKPSNCAAP